MGQYYLQLLIIKKRKGKKQMLDSKVDLHFEMIV